jgi:outer membrane cobalamin receptor
VITADDIRRSGATRLAQVLALAPGIEVARTSPAASPR